MKWFALLVVFILHLQLDNAESKSRQKRVVGGYMSPAGLFPYVVSLRINKFGPYMHFCGGAIISPRYVISSAHCMLLQEKMEQNCYKGKYIEYDNMSSKIIAVVGTNSLSNSEGISYKVDSYMYHSEFSFKLGTNDISLLRLHKNIRFTDNVSPISIYENEVPDGAVVIVPGWGLTSFPGDPSNTLKFIDLKTISYEECAKSWKKVYKSQICTFTTTGEGVCTSDSGGPLVYKGYLVGLVSFGKPCAVGFPDVFTNVSHLNKWIRFNIKCMNEPDILDTLLL